MLASDPLHVNRAIHGERPMPLPRFRIRTLMVVVAIVGIGVWAEVSFPGISYALAVFARREPSSHTRTNRRAVPRQQERRNLLPPNPVHRESWR